MRFAFTLPVVLLALTHFRVSAEDAAQLETKGLAALKQAQTDGDAIVQAAIYLGQASEAYDKAGDSAKAVEMNAFLYWCKKKMTLQQMDMFLKGDNAVAAQRMQKLDAAPLKDADAEGLLQSATAYADAHPDEHLLIAIRFYEVADRFKGTSASLRAQDRSLKEQTLALGTERPAAPVPLAPSIAAPGRLALPAALEIEKALKQIKAILKDDYATLQGADRKTLAAKLLRMASDASNDAVSRYAELSEARDVGADSGDVATAMQAIDQMAAGYNVFASPLRVNVFRKIVDAARDKAALRSLCEALPPAFDEAVRTAQFTSLHSLAAIADSAAQRTGNGGYTARLKDKSAAATEIEREFGAARSALDKLKGDPSNSAGNATAGRFTAFFRADFEQGIKLLASGDQPALKKMATTELSDPASSDAQLALADDWWDLAQKERSKVAKLNLLEHAGAWYTKSLPGLTGLGKAKAEQRLAQIAEASARHYPPTFDMEGKFLVKWEDNPQWGSRTVDLSRDGQIKIHPGENFGPNVPVKWTYEGENIVIWQKPSGFNAKMGVVDDSTLKQTNGTVFVIYQRISQ